MKSIGLLLLSAATTFAAEFVTGQAARLVIGQVNFTAQDSGATDTLVGGVSGLAFANNMLFVADANRVGASPLNHRVLIFKDVSSMLPKPTDQLFYTRECPACLGQASVVLGQPDFTSTDFSLSQTGLRLPTAVASDGNILVVADTDNNRVLIWNSIPSTNGAPADVVIGQPDFKSNRAMRPPNAKSLLGPQGVWIQDGKLYVADTQDHRVLIYNSIPKTNGVAADLVLGQPDFTTFVEPDLTKATADAKANNLLNPVSVTSDGQRLYVTDLGHNRVLVWNSIPTANQQPADFALGQPDMTSAVSNNVQNLCPPNGTDDKGNPTYPPFCEATLSFPRFALSDGQKLFIADGGNDRVLVYKNLPTHSGEPPDYIIGQLGGGINQASDSADSLRTPMSLAWDGSNLYVSDAYNRRITVYTPAEPRVPYSGVRNAFSREIFAVGTVTLSGAIQENDEITIKVKDTEYKYKVKKDDTFDAVIKGLVAAINAGTGDPNVLATPNPVVQGLILTARAGGAPGNDVSFSASVAGPNSSTPAKITTTTSGASLSGGQDAAKIAPGTIVSIIASSDSPQDSLSDTTAGVDPNTDPLPTELGGVQVYFNGVRAPLLFVSPQEIRAQMPFEFLDTTSVNAYVRTVRNDGTISVTTPRAVTIVPENPGIMAGEGTDPRPGIVMHGSSNATGTVSVDGSAKAGDVATVKIEDRAYSYTVQSADSLASIRDALIDLINQDPKVSATAAGVFTRIRLKARVPGPEGNGIRYSAETSGGSQVILSPTGQALCCANTAGARVTDDNPAVPGETIIVYGTGLGLTDPLDGVNTGYKFNGPDNAPKEFVSSLAGGKTANVLFAGLAKGMVGVYEVDLELNSDIPTNPFTQLTIAQNVYVSNIITFPVVNPNTPAP